jgi:DNA polymerase (family 10)
MDRRQVARVLEELAAMLELKGENPFRVRAYENGARAILGFSGDLSEAVKSRELKSVKGIGAGLFSNIETLVTTGRLPYYDELAAAFPPGLRECLRVPGLGARKARELHDTLGVDSLDALEAACRDGRLAAVPGFGSKSVAKIVQGIATVRSGAGRHKYSRARARAEQFRLALEAAPGVIDAQVAGSLRRHCEIVESADFVVVTDRRSELAAALPALSGVAEGGPSDGARLTARLVDGLRATIVTAGRLELPTALLLATGSAPHVAALSQRAAARGFRLEHGGLIRDKTGRRMRVGGEEGVYEALGLAFIEPELREGLGEIEAAENGSLPALVRREDLQGLLHVHTTESDGRDSLEDMLSAVRDAGYSWVAITDHSQAASYAGGLTPQRALAQRGAIERIGPRFPELRIFHGTEADILADGSIDFGDEFLDEFDVVIASVHSRFGLSREKQTRRLIRAVENPRVSVLGHPTGRLLLSRDPISVDLDAVLDAAASAGCAVEINCLPDRLDLDWRFCRGAVGRGIAMAIDPDAHSVEEIGLVADGVGIARKGWVTAKDTLNARSAADFEAWLSARRGKALVPGRQS